MLWNCVPCVFIDIAIQVTVTHGLVTGPALVVIRLTPFNFVFFIFKKRRRQSPPSFCFAQFFIFFFDRSTCLSLSLGSWVGQNTPVLFRHWIDGPSDFVNLKKTQNPPPKKWTKTTVTQRLRAHLDQHSLLSFFFRFERKWPSTSPLLQRKKKTPVTSGSSGAARPYFFSSSRNELKAMQ